MGQFCTKDQKKTWTITTIRPTFWKEENNVIENVTYDGL